MIKLLIGILVLALGIPIGILLAKFTKEELKPGRKWIKLVTFLGLVGGFVGLLIGNDVVMFSLFFISIVASQSLR